MAYMNFSEANAISSFDGAIVQHATNAPEARLSGLEWSVVAIAQRDSLSSLNAPGRLSVALGALFGGQRDPRLADPRLEALRRMAVLAWHRGYSVPVAEVKAFLAAGFTTHHYDMLLASISRGRTARQRTT